MKWLIAALALLFASPALAHSWYDPACCAGYDCAPVRAQLIEVTPRGYRFILRPGDHPLIAVETEAVVPFDSWRLRQSQDGDWHVCVATRAASEPGGRGQHIYCLYAPDMLG